MGRKNSSIIGVDVQPSSIRAVRVVYRGKRGKVVAWDSTPLPQGAIIEGLIRDPKAIGACLRSLIIGVGGQGSSVAVGISLGSQLRNITVPPVPESELPMVVEVEVEHQQVLRSAGSIYSYIPLVSPASRESHVENIAVYTAEQAFVNSLSTVIEGSGSTVEALEPTGYAMHRSALSPTPGTGVVFTLSISQDATEVGLVYNGQLVSIRRVDGGAKALLGKGGDSASIIGQAPDAAASSPHINATALEALCTQVSRIIDYNVRENPTLPAIDGVKMTVCDPILTEAEGDISQRLGVPVETVSPLQDDAPQPAGSPLGVEFAAAYGLAIRADSRFENAAVALDLYEQERSLLTDKSSRRNLIGSIVVSGVAVVVGVLMFMLYGIQINTLNVQTQAELKRAEDIRNETDSVLAERGKRANQYKALRKDGVPVPAIVSALAQNLDPDAGIDSVVIDDTLRVTISGEATSEAPMIRSVQFLQQNPILQDLSIDSYTRADNTQGISFKLSAKTIPLSRIRVPGLTDTGGQN